MLSLSPFLQRGVSGVEPAAKARAGAGVVDWSSGGTGRGQWEQPRVGDGREAEPQSLRGLSTQESCPPWKVVHLGGLSNQEGCLHGSVIHPAPRSAFIFLALPAKEAPGVEVLPWLNVPSSHLRLENVGETHGEMCLKVW